MQYRLTWLESHYWANAEPYNHKNVVSSDEAGFDEAHEINFESRDNQGATKFAQWFIEQEAAPDVAWTLYRGNKAIATEEGAEHE